MKKLGFFSPTVFLSQHIAHFKLQALVVIAMTTSLIRKFLREQGCILLCGLRGHRQSWRKHEVVYPIKFRVRKPMDVNSCPQIIFTLFIHLKNPGKGVLPIALLWVSLQVNYSLRCKECLSPVNLDLSKLATKIKYPSELVFSFYDSDNNERSLKI